MKNGLIFPVTAGIALTCMLLAGNSYAFGFGGHHRGMSAAGTCMAVMSSSQRANLKQTFSTTRQTLQTDRQNVSSAKQTLALAILSGNKDVSTQENGLTTAQQQLQKDQDSAAQQVCSQLSSTQLNAAQTLFNNMTALHASTRQQAKTYFQQAQAAAGNSQSETAE
jgi:preprotein translocase subunit SecF